MLSPNITLREVGLRDGLQILKRVVPTAQKMEWIELAYAAGQRHIEVGSFVPPQFMPQLADTAQLVPFAKKLPGLQVSVLVPNFKGAQRALETRPHSMLVPLSMSHAHSLSNLKKPPEAVIDELARMRDLIDTEKAGITLEIGLSTAFGCTLQGKVDTAEVLRLLKLALDAGVDKVGLADTVGYADPLQVRQMFDACKAVAGDKLDCGHFHDTRGLGLANVMAAWQAGATVFDACTGGIGGCPHAPGASGNVSMEDAVYLFKSMGVETGIDFDKLIALRKKVAQWLDGEALYGSIARAGLPKTLLAA
jgi:hydroxymethylglutaryl-CoA lyase